jgi:hypothetical protein
MKEDWTKAGEVATAELKANNDVEFNYIHMKNVRHIGNLVVPDPGFLWRGRLSEVTRFALGSLVPQPARFTATAHMDTARSKES